MNSIAKRQNEDIFLRFQYSARYHYNCAEISNYLVWGFCILNIIISNLPFTWVTSNKFLVTLFFGLVSLFVENKVKRYVKIGAAMRKYVDYHLFEFPIPDMFNGYSRDKLIEIVAQVTSKKPKKTAEQIKNSGVDEPRGVRDWYTGINPNEDKAIAIFKCQKQNAFWDRELSKRYIIISRMIIVGLVIVLVPIFLERKLVDMLCFLIPLFPLILKVIDEKRIIEEYGSISNSIQTLLELPSNTIRSEYLMIIQDKIDQRRNLIFLTPNLLHKFSAIKLHSIINQKNTID